MPTFDPSSVALSPLAKYNSIQLRCMLSLIDSLTTAQSTTLGSQVIDKSVLATRTFVRQYLADTIARGQASIQQYAARYTDTMTGALHCVKQGDLSALLLPVCHLSLSGTSYPSTLYAYCYALGWTGLHAHSPLL